VSDAPLLLDTNVVLWWLSGDPRLSAQTRDRVLGATAPVVVSDVSLWEIMLKRSIGKLTMDVNRYLERVDEAGFTVLPIARAHLLALDALPARAEHRDPFDRLLVAQAVVEGAALLTADRALSGYGGMVEVI
jgi:PIN domain nuclease of toxin-antitoxin system